MPMTMQYALEDVAGPAPVYPLLMPAAWDRAATQLCTPLLRGIAKLRLPYVAPAHILGVPGQGLFRKVFLRQARLDELGIGVEQMLGTAFHNVRARPASWSQRTATILSCTDDYFAAEKILHPAFLAEAAARLGATTGLVVAAPARGQLYATSLASCFADPVHARAFTWAIAGHYRQAGANQISPLPIQVSPEGRLIAALEMT